jgi:predicted Rossmann-fold nucleotide-binding protein
MKKHSKKTKEKRNFSVAIFGSARITKGDTNYKLVYDLAKMISKLDIDIITGGGPGLMNAASEGHHAGRQSKKTQSIGLRIKLDREEKEAAHLDIKKEFARFSNRLDTFMQLSNVVVVAPGGVGTMLELLYTWQLMQTNHICIVPIILLGDMWLGFLNWIKKSPLKNKYLDLRDFNLLFHAKDCDEAFRIIEMVFEDYKEGNNTFCSNYEKYTF